MPVRAGYKYHLDWHLELMGKTNLTTRHVLVANEANGEQ
jgi:hypothetical protein